MTYLTSTHLQPFPIMMSALVRLVLSGRPNFDPRIDLSLPGLLPGMG